MNHELELLRVFYASWVGFHSIPRTPGNRKRQEEAAQAMTENAHSLRVYYQANEEQTLQ